MCGFQLGLVAELLVHGGVLPQLAELTKGKRSFFTRKNGVIFSILWFIFWVMMVPAFFGIADAEEGAAISAVFGVFTTMMFLITSLAFLPKSQKVLPLSGADLPTPALYGNPQMNALPPQQTQSATDYVAPAGSWRTPDTGEFAQPGSVTDSTTKLLQKDRE